MVSLFIEIKFTMVSLFIEIKFTMVSLFIEIITHVNLVNMENGAHSSFENTYRWALDLFVFPTLRKLDTK